MQKMNYKYWLKVIVLAAVGSFLGQWLFSISANRLMDSGGELSQLASLLVWIPLFVLVEISALVGLIHYLLRNSRTSASGVGMTLLLTFVIVTFLAISFFLFGTGMIRL